MKKVLFSLLAGLTATALFAFGSPPARSADLSIKYLPMTLKYAPQPVAYRSDDCHYRDSTGQWQNRCLPFVPFWMSMCDGVVIPYAWPFGGCDSQKIFTTKTETTTVTVTVEDHDKHKKHAKKDKHGDRDKHGKKDKDDHRDSKKDRGDHKDHKDAKKGDKDEHHNVKKDDRDDHKYGKKEDDGHDKYGKKEGHKYSTKDDHGEKSRFTKDEHRSFEKFDKHFDGEKHFSKHYDVKPKFKFVEHYHFKPHFKLVHIRSHVPKFHGFVHSHPVKTKTVTTTKTTTTESSRGGHSNAAMGYVGSVIACSAASLVLDGAIVGATEHRELRYGEAYAAVGNCVVPIIGGFIGHALGDGIDPCNTPGALNYSPSGNSMITGAEMAAAYRAKYCNRPAVVLHARN